MTRAATVHMSAIVRGVRAGVLAKSARRIGSIRGMQWVEASGSASVRRVFGCVHTTRHADATCAGALEVYIAGSVFWKCILLEACALGSVPRAVHVLDGVPYVVWYTVHCGRWAVRAVVCPKRWCSCSRCSCSKPRAFAPCLEQIEQSREAQFSRRHS